MPSASTTRDVRVHREVIGDDEVDGQAQAAARVLEQAPRDRHALRVAQRIAHAMPLRGEKRIAHPATDQQRVGEPEQALDDADLVGHLRASEHPHERARRGLAGPTRSIVISRSNSSPAAERATWSATPTVEALARCALPKASLT